MTMLDAIDIELERLCGSVEGPIPIDQHLVSYADSRSRPRSVTIGDLTHSVRCAPATLLMALRALPTGTPLGTPGGEPGTIWAAVKGTAL